MVLFIIIYTLIGNQIYFNQLDHRKTGIRQSFNNFYFSFLSVFQLVSIENWNDIGTITLNSSVPTAFTIFYLLSLIFLGNYIFLNLFLGVLLEGFSNISSLAAEDEETVLDLEKLHYFEELHHESHKKIQTITKIALDDEDMNISMGLNQEKKEKKKFVDPWQEWHCEESLWYFNKDNWFRRLCFVIASSRYFMNFIFILIFANSVKLALDTFFTEEENNYSDIYDIILSSCLICEAIIKIIAFGLIFEPHTYLRDSWNVLDFLVVLVSIADLTLIDYNLHLFKVFINNFKVILMNSLIFLDIFIDKNHQIIDF